MVLTASAMEDDRRSVTRSGADNFLAKPCREDELLDMMRSLLDIEYEYEEMSQVESQTLAGVADLSAEKLGRLPLALVEEIRNATLSGNKKQLDSLIANVRESWRRHVRIMHCRRSPTGTNTTLWAYCWRKRAVDNGGGSVSRQHHGCGR